ncbi:protein of unknown function [Candidatus Filomicrobium marinum]|uniref:Uncharacterized protein n=1 Tax=Candidatus Filomicrobium marinum TaxID=1608628 RepID=A0A0D6JF83_9HYPH|nr:protein of unknown function [Candidatus Filomicrobium marinum]CPR18475.1 protein of unknown function [Candidatus Filomicrobium marinum]
MSPQRRKCSVCKGRGYLDGPSLIAGIGTHPDFCLQCKDVAPFEGSRILKLPGNHIGRPILRIAAGAYLAAALLTLAGLAWKQ